MIELVPGNWLKEWNLTAPLGRGGFSQVFAARHAESGKTAAIKIPTEPRFLEHLQREAALLLRHPHVVSTLEDNLDHDPPFLVVELLGGGSLRERLKEGRVPSAQALRIVTEVAQALEFAHEQGVLHLDVKPENVLLDEEGGARLGDFGAAAKGEGAPGVLAQSLAFSSELGRTGTHDYASPELRAGEGRLDRRADVYSLGVLAFELLTGQLPLGLDRPTEVDPNLPESVNDVLARALARDPLRRTLSAGEFAHELRQALTPPAPLVESAESRPPTGSKVLGFLTLLLVLAAPLSLWLANTEPPRPSWVELQDLLARLPVGARANLLAVEDLQEPGESPRAQALRGALEPHLWPTRSNVALSAGDLYARSARDDVVRGSGSEYAVHAVLAPRSRLRPEQSLEEGALLFLVELGGYELVAATAPRGAAAQSLAAEVLDCLGRQGGKRSLIVLPTVDARHGISNATTAWFDAELTAALTRQAVPSVPIRARYGVVPRLRDFSKDPREALSVGLALECRLDPERALVSARLRELEGGRTLHQCQAALEPADYDLLEGAAHLSVNPGRLATLDAGVASRVGAAVEEASRQLADGEPGPAVEVLEALRASGPEYAAQLDLLLLLGRAYAEQNDLPLSWDRYTAAIRLYPESLRARESYARAVLREAQRRFQAGKAPWYGDDDERLFEEALVLLSRVAELELGEALRDELTSLASRIGREL